MATHEKYLVMVPAYNAARTITTVIDKLSKLKFYFDILVVDNHSEDRTLDVAKKAFEKRGMKNFVLLRNYKNIGYGGSQKVALNFCIYHDYTKMIVVHSDGQYPVEEILRLIATNKRSGTAMTMGTRLRHKDVKKVMPVWRLFGNRVISAISRWAYKMNLDEFSSEFRIYDIDFMKRIDFDWCDNVAHYSTDSILAIIKNRGKIDQIVIPCAYPKYASHPPTLDIIKYCIYNVSRAMFYKAFKR